MPPSSGNQTKSSRRGDEKLFLVIVLALAAIAGLYGLYVLYLGFNTPMMDTPKDKVISYLVVCCIVVIVLMLIIGLVLGAIFAYGAVSAL